MKRPVTLVPSSRLIVARDRAHATTLLLEHGTKPADADRLAQDVVDGRLLLIRSHGEAQYDELADISGRAPLLRELAAMRRGCS